MNTYSIKRLFTVISILLVTSFVTACVKNASKNDQPKQIKLKNIEVTKLNTENLDGSVSIAFSDSSAIAALEVNKDYSFTVREISEFRINRGSVDNKDCSAQDSFIYHFSLIGEDNAEKRIHSKNKDETLLPGDYRLRVKVANGSLCKSISMNFDLQLKKRPDLVLTKNLEAGYQCYSVKENGAIKSNTSVVINTSPMTLVKYDPINNLSVIVDNKTLCQNPMGPKLKCSDNLNPASKDDTPIIAKKRSCKRKGQKHTRSKAELQINKALGVQSSALFTCNHKGRVLSLKLENCHLTYMLGENLPLLKKNTNIILRPDRMEVTFTIDDEKLDISSLPDDLFASVALLTPEGYEPPKKYHPIKKSELANGLITLYEHDIKARLLSVPMDRLKVVLSRSRNLKSGLFNISLQKLCDQDSQSIVEETPQGTNSLCE